MDSDFSKYSSNTLEEYLKLLRQKRKELKQLEKEILTVLEKREEEKNIIK